MNTTISFTDEYQKVEFSEMAPTNIMNYVPADLDPDSLITLKSLDGMIDRILVN